MRRPLKTIVATGIAFACAVLSTGAWAVARHSGPERYLDAASKASLDIVPESTRLGRTAGTMLEIYRPPGSGEFAQISIYAPTGFGLGLSRPVGTTIGTLLAWESTGALHLGTITVDDPAKHAADACSPGPHLAVWTLTATGMSALPAYIDQTGGSDTALGGYKIVLCVPSSATSGLSLDELDIAPVLTNPSSTALYMWRAFVTPYAGTAPNPSATYELRSREPLPMSLTLSGRRVRGRAMLAGRLVSPAVPTTGIFVDLYTEQGARFRYTTAERTGTAGRYSFSRSIRKTTRFFSEIDSYRDCQEATVAPAGCVSETMASISSPTVKVRVRRR